VQGVTLGGSRGWGVAEPQSDFDFVLYCEDHAPLDSDGILGAMPDGGAALKLTKSGHRLIGEAEGIPFEFFYRSLNTVEAIAAETIAGTFSLRPDKWFPQGKLSVEPLSFLLWERVIFDPHGKLARLRQMVMPMPQRFQGALYGFALKGAETAFRNADKVRRFPQHTMHLMSHVFLFVWYLEIGIFAVNGAYPVMCKQTSVLLDRLRLRPDDYLQKLGSVFSLAAQLKLPQAFETMYALLGELQALARRAGVADATTTPQVGQPQGVR
jgi:hypothetical protein